VLERLGFEVQTGEETPEETGVAFTRKDFELIHQSRSRERYTDFSEEEKATYKRIHQALSRMGEVAIDELGTRDYILKLTSGFHPRSGIRGARPKDLWFSVARKENERLAGNPQFFMVISTRGVEWGFAPVTHPDDFSTPEFKRRTREVARSVLEQLPSPQSSDQKLSNLRRS
jgi:hypothetical protein